MLRHFGFMLAFNALHHVLESCKLEEQLTYFDKFVIVEGSILATSEQSWQRPTPPWASLRGHSTDGTREYLAYLANKYPDKIIVVSSQVKSWSSKIAMQNACMSALRNSLTSDEYAYLWQIDADEYLSLDNRQACEQELLLAKDTNIAGKLHLRHYVDHDLITAGRWGGLDIARLWLWSGEDFLGHAPPRLRKDERDITLSKLFDHYSYIYTRDLIEKQYVYNYDNLYARVKALRSLTRDKFPMLVTSILDDPYWSAESYIIVK